MEPVEINAGEHYLRQLRADDRIDDSAALVAAFADPGIRRWQGGLLVDDEAAARKYVEFRAWQWESDQRYSWAVCDQLLGRPVGEIALKDLDPHNRSAELVCWTGAGHRGRGIATEAAGAVIRFGFGGVDLHRISYRHAVDNVSSQRVAEKLGFTLEGRLRGAQSVQGEQHDLLIWSRLETDR
ncbi:GNAT family N-acetyltransferase [Umezawaea tangerina]|uniref:RimJ/RimL family protein N-acetyltransferase n=1 Tax=Umezawaea tangerina TaxID=84725 RepID=A0A2T0TDT9_9PSEU|nr:GNAT family N-acetyltransferase [Umezawaea tangerina]PRY43788.1 RimJ/RimL family protein N-acetyltransferase [Umezawaea tangerina]